MAPSPQVLDRLPRRFPLLVLAVFLGLAALLMTPTLGDMGGDSAQYLSLAESLVAGDGYRDTYLPGRPLHAHFPPGLPALLLPVVAIFGGQAWLAAKILLLVLTLAGLGVAFLYLERRFGSWVALGSLALTISSGSFLTTSVRIQSEMPYLLATFLGLYWLDDQKPKRALLAAWSAFAIRLMGVAALLSWGLHVPSGSWKRRVGVLALALIPLLLFQVYGRLWSEGTWGYDQELLDASGGIGGLPLHLLEGFGIQFLHLGRLLGDGVWVSQWSWLQAVLGGLVFLGIAQCGRRGLQAGETFFLMSFGLAVLAPRPLERYLIPILPLSAAYALVCLRGLPAAWVRLRGRGAESVPMAARYTLLVPCLLLLASHAQALTLLYGVRLENSTFRAPPLLAREAQDIEMTDWEEGWIFGRPSRVANIQRAYADFLMTLELCTARLPAEAVLIAAKPRLVSYLTGYPCLPLPTRQALDSDEMIRLGATHLLVDGLFASTRSALPGGGDRLGLRSIATVRSSACFLLAGAPE
jgi:hypothetical protein